MGRLEGWKGQKEIDIPGINTKKQKNIGPLDGSLFVAFI
jgi:hypothetical protein